MSSVVPSARRRATFLRGHERFRRQALARERDFLRQLASEGQSPDALFVGCSDSRVVPERLTHSSPGSLFVVRNVANVIPPLEHADASVGAALEYAVGHLHVPHVIVCGHTGCGGVKAALDGLHEPHELPSLTEWLRLVKPAAQRVRELESAGGTPLTDEARWRAAVEENVVEQLGSLLSFPVVARRVEAGDLELHGWVYDLHSFDLWIYDAETDRFRSAEDVTGP